MNTLRVWGGGVFLPQAWCFRASMHLGSATDTTQHAAHARSDLQGTMHAMSSVFSCTTTCSTRRRATRPSIPRPRQATHRRHRRTHTRLQACAHTRLRAQEAELRHNIRRLAHHPAIVIWDGCNECTVIIGTDTGIYATFVMTVPPGLNLRRAARTSAPGLTSRCLPPQAGRQRLVISLRVVALCRGTIVPGRSCLPTCSTLRPTHGVGL